MSLPPQKSYSELSEKEQDLVKAFMRRGKTSADNDFYGFLRYILAVGYQSPDAIKYILQIISEANPEFVRKFMLMNDTTIIPITFSDTVTSFTIQLPVSILGNVRRLLNEFAIGYARDRIGNDEEFKLIPSSDYYKFVDEEFMKAFRIFMNPQHLLRSKNVPKLLMNAPAQEQLIQNMTGPVEQREVYLLGNRSKKQQLHVKIEDIDSDDEDEENNDVLTKEEIENDKIGNSNDEKKKEDEKKDDIIEEVVITKPQSESDLRRITVLGYTIIDPIHLRPSTAGCASGRLPTYQDDMNYTKEILNRIRQAKRDELLKKKREKYLSEPPSSTKDSRDDLKNISVEKKE